MFTKSELAFVYVMDTNEMKNRVLDNSIQLFNLLEENMREEISFLKENAFHYKIVSIDDYSSILHDLHNFFVYVRGNASAVSKFKQLTNGEIELFIDTTISKWPKKVLKEYSNCINAEFSTFKDVVKRYVKPVVLAVARPTTEIVTPMKLQKTEYCINSYNDLKSFEQSLSFLPDDYPIIIRESAEPVFINSYRAVISNFYVSSIACKEVENVNSTPPKEVVNFLMDFSNKHRHFPNSYVIDVILKQDQILVDNVIDIECGERYSKNSFKNFLQFIVD